MCARVAQWWSIALPRRGSRGRIPSRALNDTKKEISVGYLFFCMFEPCRVRTVRMSPLRCGRRSRTSPGRSATSRALKEIEKRVIRWVSLFLYIQVLPGSNGSNVCVPLRLSQQFQMLVNHRIAWYDKICSEMLAECISRNCRQHAIEFMHEGHTLKKV